MMDIRDAMLWIVLAGFFGFVVYLLCGFARILDDREKKQGEDAKMGSYVIVGDTERNKGCMVCVCNGSREHAESVLYRMLNNPTESDKYSMRGHTNLRIKETNNERCWWEE